MQHITEIIVGISSFRLIINIDTLWNMQNWNQKGVSRRLILHGTKPFLLLILLMYQLINIITSIRKNDG